MTVPFSAGNGNVGKFMPSPAAGDRGEGRDNGEALSGDGCGVRICAAKAFFGCGDLMTAGSDVIVRVSLGSRECVERRFGRFVESKRARATFGLASDFKGTSGAFSSGGVAGESGDTICGVKGCALSVFRYSGVGRRLKEVYGFGASSLLDSVDDSARFLVFSFASLFPIKSGCGGAGRAGMGFLPARLRGMGALAGCSFLGGLAVDPLLLSNFNSGKLRLFSLLSDRRFQISGRDGEDRRLDKGLAKMMGLDGVVLLL